MIDAIVYCSNSGFTKQYAYRFAVKTGLPIYSINDIKKLDASSRIVYFSWIKNNKIFNLNKVKRFNIIKISVVGMTMYKEEYIELLKKENNVEELYYLQGGLRMYKLSILDRYIVNSFGRKLKRKNKKIGLTLDEQIVLDLIYNGSEFINLESLDILVDWYNFETNNFIC